MTGVRSSHFAHMCPPLCNIPSGGCFPTGPWTVTRSSLRMLRWVAAFCRPLRPVFLLASFPCSRSPVVGVLGLCWMWHGVPFACQRRPIIGVLRMCWMLPPPKTLPPPPPNRAGPTVPTHLAELGGLDVCSTPAEPDREAEELREVP